MGSPSLNYLNSAALVLAAYLLVFLESSLTGLRTWLGAQPELLPVIMIYCGLNGGLVTLAIVASLGGLWFDALSANPLGISVLPQYIIGFSVYHWRDLILRDQLYARFILGLSACALAPLATVSLLWAGGFRPLIGWGSLWQWAVVAVGGGLLTPPCFWMFDRINHALSYSRTAESPFRADREIKRGRL